jgi:hypothetical protein
VKLADVMGAARLEVFAEIGLVLFALAFATVLVTTCLRRNRPFFERARRLPLDDKER